MSQEKSPPEPPPIPFDYDAKCEIALTPQQIAFIKSETGRDMDVLILEDEDAMITRNMATSNPDDFSVIALRQAHRLNEYDEDYHAYLIALAAWQKSLNEPDPDDALIEASQVAAIQEAERLKLFYMKEAEACQNARDIAKIAWGKKDKTK